MSDIKPKEAPSKTDIGVTVATPCFGGMLSEGYFHSILKTSAAFSQKKNWKLYLNTMGNESLITRGRNTLVAQFMDMCNKHPNDYTHMMFIDSDIAFPPQAIARMIAYDKDIVGGVYPRKSIAWDTLLENVKKGDFKQIQQKALGYNINFSHPQSIQMEKGFVEVLDTATGFMLIKKQVFYKLQKAYPYLKYTSDQIINGAKFKSDNCYAFFDCIIDEKSNRYLSEDYAFCRLWQKIGGKIYADLMTPLNHYGTYNFEGNVWSKFGVAEKDKHKIKKEFLDGKPNDIHKSNK